LTPDLVDYLALKNALTNTRDEQAFAADLGAKKSAWVAGRA
jgi:hypothetical protein